MILADTSAWVEFDRATGSSLDARMTELVGAASELAVTEPVLMEVLAGARSSAHEALMRRLLATAHLLPVAAEIDFDTAARVYRLCREAGVTPRGLLDCLIAAVAWRTGAALLHRDVDLSRIANVIGVPCDPASPQAS